MDCYLSWVFAGDVRTKQTKQNFFFPWLLFSFVNQPRDIFFQFPVGSSLGIAVCNECVIEGFLFLHACLTVSPLLFLSLSPSLSPPPLLSDLFILLLCPGCHVGWPTHCAAEWPWSLASRLHFPSMRLAAVWYLPFLGHLSFYQWGLVLDRTWCHFRIIK